MKLIKLKDGLNAVELNQTGVKVVYNDYNAPCMIVDEINHRVVFDRRDDDLIDYVTDFFNAYTFIEIEVTDREFRALIDSI